MSNLLMAIAGLVLIVSAFYDIRFRILPDTASIILVVLAVVRWCWAGEWVELAWSFAYASGVFIVCAMAFARGWIGGGDVKLISAASFFLGAGSVASFVVATSLAGGGVSLIVLARVLAMRRVRAARPAAAAAVGHTVPYGAAIALAGLYILYIQFRSGVN